MTRSGVSWAVTTSTWIRRHRALTEVSVAVLIGWLVLRVAWMSDDGLINVRAALNLAHGNGAGFNAGERVQAFTSPLWFGLEYLTGRMTGEYIVGAIVLGGLCAVAGVMLIAHRARTLLQAIAVVAIFALSSSLIDYATGGLENGLAMLLLAAFLVLAHVRYDAGSHGAVGAAMLGVAAAAVVLTRYDFVLLMAPALAVVALATWRSDRRAFGALVAGTAVPIATWFAVSWAYFGSIVPNTLAAKTNVDIGAWDLIGTGLNYLAISVWSDPVLTFAIVAGVALAVACGNRLQRAVAAGVVLYLAYVVWIGGDFMAGRFLTTPAIASMWLLSTVELPTIARWNRHQVATGLVAAIVVLGAWPMILARPAADSEPRWDMADTRGVADEAAFWRSRHDWTLANALFGDDGTGVDGASTPGLGRLRAVESKWFHYTPPPSGVERPVGIMCGGLGVYGVSAGPALYVIDQCALTDAFLAQQPWTMPDDGNWRIGHWVRELPDGYVDAVRFADVDRLTDPALRAQLAEIWRRVR